MTTPVYLNHAGCSKVSRQTLETILRHHALEAALGVYEADQGAASDKHTFYTLAADLVGAEPGDIAYTDSHTAGWEKALRRLKVGPGDVLLTSRSEWGGNLKALYALAQAHGAHVRLMPEALDVLAAAAAPPPIMAAQRIGDRWAFDGGYTDNAPIPDQSPAQRQKTLVMLTRHYSSKPSVFTIKDRTYWQPSRPVPVSTWDCTDKATVTEAFELGSRDAEAALASCSP